MIRTERYVGGRLVKEIAQVDTTSTETMRHEWVDGTHRWLLDGRELTTAAELEAALSLLAQWTAGKLEEHLLTLAQWQKQIDATR